jgi:hypothetical protein
MDKLEGAEKLVVVHIQSARDAVLVAKAQKNPFVSARELKDSTNFPGHKCMVILRLKEAGLRAWHAAVKDVLTDEHEPYRQAFSESSVDFYWDKVIFSDESTFSSSSDGPVLAFRPWGRALQLSICVDTQWSCDCSLLGLDHP